ncbi:MAG TPA: hypothetical protein PKG54_02855 [Phycisphaerae bacterium]|jgi:hypothetical protein|nr:hypothetical protein [Phycisphaerae bacterium]HOB73443.1 hypothetical protein [Phycisphaerae bacterium]HOJ55970.1 hypothetical protein [Phycisphaerae bacterium]HOL25656.1 hypothetical protein [Phycisphaerae bacterium]HPP22118.1 hypothetical protein [Phycisphaerae bacterium]
MPDEMIGRRDFLEASAGAAGLALGVASTACAGGTGWLRIDEPFHGAVLNRRHGQSVDGGLKIRVRGEAPLDDQVTVNGVVAQRAGRTFTAEIVLREKETDIVAATRGSLGQAEHRVRVVWDRLSKPRYRFSIDDNSYFLRDIAQKKYKSLFDCFYLKILRDLHRKYKTRFVLNVFYATEDGFELSEFPDRYKGEWQDNADWLKLAFHARSEFPDRLYQHASPATLIADYDKVTEQILRFAGERTCTPPTVIHWAMTQPSAFKPLYQRGVRVLSGYFIRVNGRYDINYLLDDERSEYLSRHDALKDFDSGIVFSKVDIVCNSTPIDRIVPTLEPLAKDPNQAEIMDLFTHEQYFWKFYKNYVPDHAERLDTAIRWVTEHGYEPVFFHEGFLGGAE